MLILLLFLFSIYFCLWLNVPLMFSFYIACISVRLVLILKCIITIIFSSGDIMIPSVIDRYRYEVAVKTNQWSAGTFGCFNNVGVSLLAFALPCVSFGNTAEALGKSCLTAGLLYWIPFLNCYISSQQRGELRDVRGIPGSFLGKLDSRL